ncbi:MAG: Ni,Fe-hydrogenase maturation factor, partial [Candidatus Duberdicusella sinuisediminis]
MYKKIIILGLGNLLYKDEGIGIHLIRELEKMKLPPNLELIDGGVGSLDILLSLENIDKLIIIDALKGGGAPATVY